MGRHGESFTILKFRTMPFRKHTSDRPAVTTSINQRFTPVGPFLRRWKLDELPQIFNVIRGDMSLVGPRPKLPKHQSTSLTCRPGITGRATVVFAREEVALSSVPNGHLDSYYHGVVLPLKHALDNEYMARATFISDLKLIIKSVLRRWDDVALTDLASIDPHLARVSAAARTAADRAAKQHSSPIVLPAHHPLPADAPLQES
jgi:lipopolysaccharide/colanic/teichoic acid biosynthesis glycosyltransferase